MYWPLCAPKNNMQSLMGYVWRAIQLIIFFVCIFSLWRTTGFGGSEITLWCPVTPCSSMSSGEVCHPRSTPSMRTARANLCSSKVRFLHVPQRSLRRVEFRDSEGTAWRSTERSTAVGLSQVYLHCFTGEYNTVRSSSSDCERMHVCESI